jgi:hypothetical protein
LYGKQKIEPSDPGSHRIQWLDSKIIVQQALSIKEYRALLEATEDLWWKTFIAVAYSTYFTKNDGMVPLESAKFDTHPDIEAINISDVLLKSVDHLAYLDYAPIMDYINSYILEFAAMPTPTSPEDGVTLDTLTPTFTWSSFPGTSVGLTQTGYQLRVRSDSDADAIVYDTGFVPSTSAHSHTYSPGIYSGYDSTAECTRISQALQPNNKHYHWHVRYRDSEANWSGWSADNPDPHQDFYTPTIGSLSVTPATGLNSSGYVGGPFSPSNQAYILSNTGGMAITVSISGNQPWISVLPSSVTLTAAQSTTVTVSVNSNANSLSPASYPGTVSFVNTTNHSGDTNRPVSLLVSPYVTSLEISGPAQVNERSGAQYTCIARYSNGSLKNVTNDTSTDWYMVNTVPYASINRDTGYLTTSEVTSDQQCQIEAENQSKSLVISPPYVITIKNVPNKPPVISSVTATPATISIKGTSQLQVVASDPDHFPASLTYKWTVPAGKGSVSNTTIANPIYTPPSNVSGTETFTLTVEVSDGEATTTGTVNITVESIYEAEDAFLSGPVKSTVFPGYTGTGFADYVNPSNDYIEWTVNVGTSG